jgi:hypothetical protein
MKSILKNGEFFWQYAGAINDFHFVVYGEFLLSCVLTRIERIAESVSQKIVGEHRKKQHESGSQQPGELFQNA